jgi:hypothetical protein
LKYGSIQQTVCRHRAPAYLNSALIEFRHREEVVMSINWPWAIILCKFNDVPLETRPPAYYSDLFTQYTANSLGNYWYLATCGTINITGSKVFGWLTMNHSSVDSQPLQNQQGRPTRFQWGIDAATAAGIDLSPFKGTLVIQNFGGEHGAINIGTGQVLVIHQNSNLYECGFFCHEMGHGFGLYHSFSANPDVEYGDAYDIMSWETSVFEFPVNFEGASGGAAAGLNAPNLMRLGAVPHGCTWQPAHPDFSETVVLDPLNRPPAANHNFLVATIPPLPTVPPQLNASTFTAEFHQKAGWDQAIPEDAVVIHEIRPGSPSSFLQPTAWSHFTQGQIFTTPDKSVSFLVTAIDHNAAKATLRIWNIVDGVLKREHSSAPVYLIQNGIKRWIMSPGVLFTLGKTWNDVLVVPDGALNNIPLGPPIGVDVTVTPYPVGTLRPVSVTVHASVANIPIAGVVKIEGRQVGITNSPFTHTFEKKRILVKPGPPPQYGWVYPSGDVEAVNFPNTPIVFGGS